MTSKVNADNTLGGVILSGDSSGILELQAGGVTKVTVGPSGVTLADVLPVTSGGTGASSLSGITVGTATSAGTATNVAGGVAGNVPYQTGAGATSFVTNGTAGQVLTSAGAAAPTWNTLTVSGSGGATATGSVTLTSASEGAQSITPVGLGNYVKLPDATTMTKAACVFNVSNTGGYTVKVLDYAGNNLGFINPKSSVTVGLADNSTSTGAWTVSGAGYMAVTAAYTLTGSANLDQVISIDGDRDLIIFSSGALYAMVFNQATSTWGALTLIRSGTSRQASKLIGADTVLVTSTNNSTAMQAVVLSISGTTITVNTAATKTVTSGAIGESDTNKQTALIACGSTYISLLYTSAASKMIAATVSGTTVTLGAETSMFGTSSFGALYTVDSSTILAISVTDSTAVYAEPFSVSGTTLTVGTRATVASTSATLSNGRVGTVSNGARWWMMYQNSSSLTGVSVFSVSGTVATASTVSPFTGLAASATSGPKSTMDVLVTGSKIIVGVYDSITPIAKCNIITDSGGTASAGTQVTVNTQSTLTAAIGVSTNGTSASFYFVTSSSGSTFVTLNITGSSPTVILAQTNPMPNDSDTYIITAPATNWNSTKKNSFMTGTLLFAANGSTTRSIVCSLGNYSIVADNIMTTTGEAYSANNNMYVTTTVGLSSTVTVVRYETIT